MVVGDIGVEHLTRSLSTQSVHQHLHLISVQIDAKMSGRHSEGRQSVPGRGDRPWCCVLPPHCSLGLRGGSNMGKNLGDDQSHQLIHSHHHVHFHDTQKCAQGTDRLLRKRQQTAADAFRAFFLPDAHQSVVS